MCHAHLVEQSCTEYYITGAVKNTCVLYNIVSGGGGGWASQGSSSAEGTCCPLKKEGFNHIKIHKYLCG